MKFNEALELFRKRENCRDCLSNLHEKSGLKLSESLDAEENCRNCPLRARKGREAFNDLSSTTNPPVEIPLSGKSSRDNFGNSQEAVEIEQHRKSPPGDNFGNSQEYVSFQGDKEKHPIRPVECGDCEHFAVRPGWLGCTKVEKGWRELFECPEGRVKR